MAVLGQEADTIQPKYRYLKVGVNIPQRPRWSALEETECCGSSDFHHRSPAFATGGVEGRVVGICDDGLTAPE